MAVTRFCAVLVFAAGCDITLSIDQPIVLVPSSTMSESDVQVIARAAKCWELEFGVPFTLDAQASQQRIVIGFNELMCIGGIKGGQFSAPNQIDICPTHILQPRAFPSLSYPDQQPDVLFMVVVHELGHAAGILWHADELEAVMGQSTDLESLAHLRAGFGYTTFSAADRALFEDAHGAPTGSCVDQLRFVKSAATTRIDPIDCTCI